MPAFEPASRPEDLHRLLESSSWVRRLASQLLWDESLTDDVVQEVLISALQRPPSRSDALRVWLRTVVRSLCLRANRTLLRRRRLESQAEPRLEAPAVDDIEAKLESQRLLLQAVLALGEPYRSVIHLHFYENLKLVEIARLRKISDSTVRTQLARGLEQLRKRLANDCGGRDALRAMLLLVVLPTALLSLGTLTAAEPSEPPSPPQPRPSSPPSPAHRLRVITSAGAACILLTALVGWLLTPWPSDVALNPPATQPTTVVAVAPVEATLSARVVEPPAEPQTTPKLATATLSPATTGVTVRVIHAAGGEAIPGARIYRAPRTQPRSELLGETASTGALQVSDPIALRDPWLVLAAGFVEHREPAMRRDTAGPEHWIVLEPEHLAVVAVRAADGSPVAGVDITLSARIRGVATLEPFRVRTNPAGEAQYTFQHLDTTVRIETPGHVTLSLPAVTPRQEIHLRPGRRFEGLAVGPNGVPVANCRVRLESASLKNAITVQGDAHGIVPLGILDPHETVTFRFTAAGLPAHRLQARPPEAEGPWRFELPAGTSVDGWVLGPDGEPVSSGHVFVLTPESSDVAASQGPACELRTAGLPPNQRATRRLQTAARVSIDAQGRFELGPIAPAAGDSYLFVHHPAFARHLQLLEAGEAGKTLTIQLEEGVKIVGEAMAPDGKPVAGALLHFGEIWSNGVEGVIGRTRTDAEGRFELSGLPRGVGQALPGAWEEDQLAVVRSHIFVSAFAPDVLLTLLASSAPESVSNNHAGSTGDPCAGGARRPSGAEEGEDAARRPMWGRSSSPTRKETQRLSDFCSGSEAQEALEISPGAFDIAAEIDSGRPLRLLAGAKNRLATLHVRLRDATGLPTRTWTRAIALDREGRAHAGILGGNSRGARFFSDQTLTMERWSEAELFLFPEGHSWLSIAALDLTSDGALDVELAPPLAQAWHLRLLQADGSAVPAGQVLLGLPFGAVNPLEKVPLGTTDADGTLTVTCLPPGRHTIGLATRGVLPAERAGPRPELAAAGESIVWCTAFVTAGSQWEMVLPHAE